MSNIQSTTTFLRSSTVTLSFLGLFGLASSCHKSNGDIKKELRDFQQVNLVANNDEYGARQIDPTLVDAWGLAFSSTGTPWVNATFGHVSEVYSAEGAIVRQPVKIPSPADTVGGLPIGIVFSAGKGFTLSNGQASVFLFVGADGILSGWNPAAGSKALLIGNNSATSAYTGLALASNGSANYIYAANFRGGKIDTWDTSFAPVSMSFKDPALPTGFSPFNIQAIGNWLYVTYAKAGPDGRSQNGEGNGFVDIFKTDGSFVRRFAGKGTLNSPWGITQTPAGFLQSHDMGDDGKNAVKYPDHGNTGSQSVILVGNFGDGRINVFTQDGQYLGQLQSKSKTIVIDGLWALAFPPSTATTIDPNRLYFTAGPDKETDGLFGYLTK